tara:strand:+ start:114 stop:254 length:141 start_codon:yes stop_codon:yes gene_type:complete
VLRLAIFTAKQRRPESQRGSGARGGGRRIIETATLLERTRKTSALV